MARKLRIEYSGALYHVTARGNDRQVIIRTDADWVHLLALLAERLSRYEVTLYAYVLMANHYRLVVETAHPNLNHFMHALNTAYTVWSNKRNRRTGHLFEGPYRAIAMEQKGYLLTVSWHQKQPFPVNEIIYENCTRWQRRSALPWKRARVRFLRISPGCWNFRLGLDYEQRCRCAGDKRKQ